MMLNVKNVKEQLFVKSLGYGILIAEVVPRPETDAPKNGSLAGHSKSMDGSVRSSGIIAQEVLLDPQDPYRVVVVMMEGLPPCIHERNQTQDEDWGCMERVLDASGSQCLADRLELLKREK